MKLFFRQQYADFAAAFCDWVRENKSARALVNDFNAHSAQDAGINLFFASVSWWQRNEGHTEHNTASESAALCLLKIRAGWDC